jgi:hypothetical protein
MIILNCRFCNKKPLVNNNQLEYTMAFNNYSIQCLHCHILVATNKNDVTAEHEEKCKDGWDILSKRFLICEKETIRKWNIINTKL